MASMQEERRKILEAVAAGTLTPTEAAEQLAALDEYAEAASTSGAGSEDSGVRRVRVQVAGFPVRILGDPRVREAIAEGPYSIQREDDALVITAEAQPGSWAMAFASVGGGERAWARRDRSWRSPQPLTVRMRPDLELVADVTASSVVVRDVKGPLTLAVSAGGVKVTGFASPIDLDVTAGGLSAVGVLDRGSSRLRCSAGSARVTLERGSSVRVRGLASAGRLVLPHAPAPSGTRRAGGLWVDQHMETVIGDGRGELDIEVTTGNVVVRAEE
jgi:hypothetical protein